MVSFPKSFAAVVVAVTVAVGCVGLDGKGDPMAEPTVAGKADFTDHVDMKGDLELVEAEGALEAEATASFTEDFEYHGYRLLTRGGATLRIEVTLRGTNRALDTALYVYGPRRDSLGFQDRLAFDDDSGWGKLSRLDAFVPPETGEYLIVVGTYSGLGRGEYRLEVECATGDCLDVDAPASCPERVADDIDGCVAEWLAEGDYEGTRHEAFVACTTDHAGDFYDYSCASSFHAPEPWCPAGMDVFLADIMPGCVEALAPYYPEDRPAVTLRARPLGDEIDDRLHADSYGHAWASGASYTVQPPESGEEVTFEWVVDSVRQAQELASLLRSDGEVPVGSFAAFADSFGLGDDFVDLLEADAGSERFRLGKLDANWYCAAGAECWVDLFVFVFDNGVVTAIDFNAGEE